MNKTWERLILYADNLGLEFEFTGKSLKFYSQDDQIGELNQCKPAGWVLKRNDYRYLQFSNQPKKLISLIREIA
jgi:hypothetical protein